MARADAKRVTLRAQDKYRAGEGTAVRGARHISLLLFYVHAPR
jgi:hypothetical protein